MLKASNLSPSVIAETDLREQYARKWEAYEETLGEADFERPFAALRLVYVQDKPEGDLLHEFESRVYAEKNRPSGDAVVGKSTRAPGRALRERGLTREARGIQEAAVVALITDGMDVEAARRRRPGHALPASEPIPQKERVQPATLTLVETDLIVGFLIDEKYADLRVAVTYYPCAAEGIHIASLSSLGGPAEGSSPYCDSRSRRPGGWTARGW